MRDAPNAQSYVRGPLVNGDQFTAAPTEGRSRLMSLFHPAATQHNSVTCTSCGTKWCSECGTGTSCPRCGKEP